MTISSRTPEGDHNVCPICHHEAAIDPSTVPTRDAPCPNCGHLLWFNKREERSTIEQVFSHWESKLREMEAERAPAPEPEPELVPVGSTVSLGLHPLNDPSEVSSAEDMFWKLPE